VDHGTAGLHEGQEHSGVQGELNLDESEEWLTDQIADCRHGLLLCLLDGALAPRSKDRICVLPCWALGFDGAIAFRYRRR
jgi:hypothetical protein